MKLSEKTLELMKEITQIIGVSGNEKYVSRALQNYYKQYTDEIIFDNLGAVFAVRRCGKENAPRVMVCGHMDEVGFIVKEFSDSGLIKVLPLGPISNQTLIGQRVRLLNRKGKEIKGVIVPNSSEFLISKEKGKSVSVETILVDVGVSSKTELIDLGVSLGDSIVIDGDFDVLASGKRIVSKAWDSRYGCIMGIELLETLKDVELEVDLYVGCTVQEEVGLRGAQTATNLIKPDLAIVMDVLHANDTNGKGDAVGKLGEGVLASYYDKSMMPNRALLNHLVSICKENNIQHQYYYSMDDSDAGWIHKLLVGCPTLKACICGRNIHTNTSIIDVNDYLGAKESITEVIKSLNSKKIEEFKAENR